MNKTITITGDSIPLPKALAKKWRGATVDINEAGLIAVRQNPASRPLKELLPVLREAGKKLNKSDLKKAFQWARARQA